MNIDLSTYPLNVLQSEKCTNFLNQTIQEQKIVSLDEILADSIGSILKHLLGANSIGDTLLYAIKDSILEGRLADFIKEQTNLAVSNKEMLRPVLRNSAVILHMIVQQYYIRKRISASHQLRSLGRAVYSLVSELRFGAMGEALIIESIEEDCDCDLICWLYIMALLMHIYSKSSPTDHNTIDPIREIANELLHTLPETKACTTYEELAVRGFSYVELPILFEGEKIQNIYAYAVESQGDLIDYVRDNLSSNLSSIIKSYIDKYYDEMITYEQLGKRSIIIQVKENGKVPE